MSLDVYLTEAVVCRCGDIHITGHTKWCRNITHNVGRIAARVTMQYDGKTITLYQAMWHPEEVFNKPYIPAMELAPLLSQGLKQLHENASELRKLNPENRWGSYEGLCEFIDEYLIACNSFPNAAVSTST